MNRALHVAIWLRMLAVGEIRHARQTFRLLKMQGDSAADAFKNNGIYSAEKVITEGIENVYRILTGNYADTIKQLSAYTFEQLGYKKRSFEDRIQEFITREGLKKSRLVTSTTTKILRDAINEGQAQGLGDEGTSKLIRQSIGGDIAASRARTIARTETHNAATYAMQASAEETNLTLIREWVSVHDERTREAHASVDGQQRGMDEPFDVVGGEFSKGQAKGVPRMQLIVDARSSIRRPLF
jgi:uncharacterized protein with gpF-like domain